MYDSLNILYAYSGFTHLYGTRTASVKKTLFIYGSLPKSFRCVNLCFHAVILHMPSILSYQEQYKGNIDTSVFCTLG